jgi:hypothetical protein
MLKHFTEKKLRRLNSDGVTFGGTYTTTSDDLGDNWLYIGDDDCGNVASLEWAVIEFDGWFVYNATWVDDSDVAAVKASGSSVEVDAMPFPLNLNAPSLYDWRNSDRNISWRSPIWGGYASKNDPYEYYYCVSLDDYQTWNWLNVWVIWATIAPLSANSTETTISPDLYHPPPSGVAYGATSIPYNYLNPGTDDGFISCRNGILFQATLAPSGVGDIVGFTFKRTRKVGVWTKGSSGWMLAAHDGPGADDGPGSDSMDLTPHNNHIYNADVPGFASASDYMAYEMVEKGSLGEYVQVNINGWQKCSDDYLWHTVVWIHNNLDAHHPTWSRVTDNDIDSGPLPFDNTSSTP